MARGISWLVGLRYVRTKRRNHFISFISLVSMLGITLGVTVLITVLSVVNGFERELRDRILGVTPHVMISDLFGPMADWRSVQTQVERLPGVIGVAPFVSVQGIISRGQTNKFVTVTGVDPRHEGEVSLLPGLVGDKVMTALANERFGILIGEGLAKALDVGVGDKLVVLTTDGNGAAFAGAVARSRAFHVIGTFRIGAEMDSSLAVVNWRDAAELADFRQGEVSGLRLRLNDVFLAPGVAEQIRGMLQGEYYTADWTRSLGNLFSAIQMSKRQMFLLLMLIIAVAAFNIVSTLVMAVTDKRSDIAILRTLGASPRTIMGIFVVQGALNGVIGTALGVVIGVALALSVSDIAAAIERTFGIQFLSADVYFINFLPSQLVVADVLAIAAASIGLCLLATIYPAWRAARVQPAEALRYD